MPVCIPQINRMVGRFVNMVKRDSIAYSMTCVTDMMEPAPRMPAPSGLSLWPSHPGQRTPGILQVDRPLLCDEPPARVGSWPPLRSARLRDERESVVVVLPTGSR